MPLQEPGVLSSPAALVPLGPVSPSRFTAMQSCALRVVWAAARTESLLPSAPAALLGTVTHRLLEEAARGDFTDAGSDAIERRWQGLVDAAEHRAAEHWLDRRLVPLSHAIPDFEVRRLQALSAADALAREASAARQAPVGASAGAAVGGEVPVATPDGAAAGRIDVVAREAGGLVIKDYKTGLIRDPAATSAEPVKESYASQLKLYAAMYAAMTGTWPWKLELVPVAGQPTAVDFTREECDRLLHEAVRLTHDINAVVTSDADVEAKMARLGSPAPGTCAHCPYRPQCLPYKLARRRPGSTSHRERWPIDVRGTVVEQHLLGNGRIMLVIENGETTFYIRGIDPDPQRHPALTLLVQGDALSAFNLRRAGGETALAEGPMSVFYKLVADAQVC